MSNFKKVQLSDKDKETLNKVMSAVDDGYTSSATVLLPDADIYCQVYTSSINPSVMRIDLRRRKLDE